MSNKAKILLLDIETSPLKSYTWGLFKQNVGINMIAGEWSVLTWAAKWLGDKETLSDSQWNYVYANPEDDYHVVSSMWELLDEADIVIGHNGDAFDLKKLNARFAYHKLTPPSPYQTIDTLKVARKNFKFTSNKLDYLAQHLGVGKKMKTGGFELWDRCMQGDEDSWMKMLKYNIRDVKILEKVYKELLPWIGNHPNVANYSDKEKKACPNCGSSKVYKRGHYHTKIGRYQKYICDGCGAFSKERISNQTPVKRKAILSGCTA